MRDRFHFRVTYFFYQEFSLGGSDAPPEFESPSICIPTLSLSRTHDTVNYPPKSRGRFERGYSTSKCMVARKDESRAEEWRPRSNETLLVARDTRFRGCRGGLTGFEERRASRKMVSRVFRGETGGRVWRENVLKDWHAIRFDRRPPAARAHETTRPSRRRRRSPRGAMHHAISSLAIVAPSCHGIVENCSLLCPYHRPDEGYAVLSAEIVRIHGGSRTTASRCF